MHVTPAPWVNIVSGETGYLINLFGELPLFESPNVLNITTDSARVRIRSIFVLTTERTGQGTPFSHARMM